MELMFTLSASMLTWPSWSKRSTSSLKLCRIWPPGRGQPADAAVHDAYGKANSINSYDALSSKFMNDDLSES